MDRDGQLDLIVVGAGITGLASALAAQHRGLRVRCLEAGRPGAGQSAGRTRIFRHRHDELRLLELAVRARRAWDAGRSGSREGSPGTRGCWGRSAGGEPLYAVALHSSEIALPDGTAPIPTSGSIGAGLERTAGYVAEVFPGSTTSSSSRQSWGRCSWTP